MNALEALESAVRLNRMVLLEKITAGDLTPTQVIACDGLVEAWTPGVYTVGEARRHRGQTWRCCQGHDSTANPAWAPGAEGTEALWAAYHTMDPARARPWVAPTGAHDAYQTGECMVWSSGAVYRCTADGVVHGPDTRPEAWEAVEI